MQVVVIHHHDSQRHEVFEGDDAEVVASLRYAFPWLVRRVPVGGIHELVAELNRAQAYTASIANGDIILKSEPPTHLANLVGHKPELERALRAAAFIADLPPTTPDDPELRPFLDAYESPVKAALAFYGLPPEDHTYLASVSQVMETMEDSNVLIKAESKPVEFNEVVAATPEGEHFAAAVREAVGLKQVVPVELGGKHSSGALIATDQHHRKYLLKPGGSPATGPVALQHPDPGPQAGIRDEGASPAKREAAFYAVAVTWGLGDDLVEAHLLLLDNKEYAAMRLLGPDFKDFNALRAEDPGKVQRLLRIPLSNGTLHRWAVLDYILANADRNFGNIMARGDEIKLIDHGSTLADKKFNPRDPATFVPAYLRAWAPPDFNFLPPARKLEVVPRLAGGKAEELNTWLQGLDPETLKSQLARYGVDAAPEISRLQNLQSDAREVPADLAVLQTWFL